MGSWGSFYAFPDYLILYYKIICTEINTKSSRKNPIFSDIKRDKINDRIKRRIKTKGLFFKVHI